MMESRAGNRMLSWIVLTLATLAVLPLGSAGVTAVVAQASPPTRFYGSVTVSGGPAAAGTSIEARIDGRVCGAVTVTADGSYALDVASAATQPGCGVEGIAITFLVGGAPAQQTATFQPGAFIPLTLTAGVRVAVFPDYGGGATDYLCWDAAPADVVAYRISIWKWERNGWRSRRERVIRPPQTPGWFCASEDVRAALGPGAYVYGLEASIRLPSGGNEWRHLGFTDLFHQ